jgi:uncharacterized protein (TIRG00374 family)
MEINKMSKTDAIAVLDNEIGSNGLQPLINSVFKGGTFLMTSKKLILFFKIALMFLIFRYIYSKMDFDQFKSVIHRANYLFLLSSFLLVIFNIFTQILKWYLLVNSCHLHFSLRNSTKAIIGGITLGIATPSRIGELGRILFTKNINYATLTGFYFIDKLMNFTALITFCLIGIFFIPNIYPYPYFLILLLLLLMLIYLWFHPAFFIGWLRKKKLQSGYKEKIKIFMESLCILKKSTIFYCIFQSYLFYIITFIQFFFLLKACYSNVPFGGVLVSYVIMVISSSLPITPSGAGVRESASMKALSMYHVPKEAALAAVVLLFIMNVVLPAIIGIFVLLRHNFFKGEKKEMMSI